MGILTAEDYKSLSSISKYSKTLLSNDVNRQLMSSHSKKQKTEITKQAEEQFKDKEFEDESQVPDEIIVNGQVVPNPHKEEQLKQVRENAKSGEGFNPQINPEDARVFTKGQVDNKSDGGLTSKVETAQEEKEGEEKEEDQKEKEKAEKEDKDKASTGGSQSSSGSRVSQQQHYQNVRRESEKKY